MLGTRIVPTDMASPGPETLAGEQLEANMLRLRQEGCSLSRPLQQISALEIPQDLKEGTAVFLAGSPAGHDPANRRFAAGCQADNRRFKQNVFYSMCWNTPPQSGVAMTFSESACGRLEWWSIPGEQPPRVLMVVPAWFATYRPRLGLADSLEELADEPDTMLALYAPPTMVQDMCWNQGRLDAAATIVSWLGAAGRLVTFAAYAAELEVDILLAASRKDVERLLAASRKRRHFEV